MSREDEFEIFYQWNVWEFPGCHSTDNITKLTNTLENIIFHAELHGNKPLRKYIMEIYLEEKNLMYKLIQNTIKVMLK